MRIEILDSAEKDLLDGFKFYERQSKGLGNYFLESLFSNIYSLNLYAGIHAIHFGLSSKSSVDKRETFVIFEQVI